MKEARNILNKEVVSVSGSIGASAVSYNAQGIQPRRDPFYWVLNANLNLTIFDKVSVPFNAVITQRDRNFSNGIDKFSQPFNQFGISPRYRWLTLHAGFRSLEFSEYTLAGAMFMGGGVEVAPPKSRVSGAAFYGRFVKGIPQGGVDGIYVSVPAYARWGGGAKVKVGTESHSGEFIFLKIRDDINSIPFDTSLEITPEENEIFSFRTKQRISAWLSASGELAMSMFTRNLYSETTRIEKFTYINQIFTPRTSSTFNTAGMAQLDITPGRVGFGLRYRRVDPDYRTLGAVFLTNDVEELSVNATTSLLQNRMNASTAVGLQRNNLDKIQALTTRRLIGSLNVSFNVSENLNLCASYSDFSSNSLPVRDVFTDTVRFVQLTRSANVSGSFGWGSQSKHQLVAAGTYQQSGGNTQPRTVFYNCTLAYNITFGESSWGINAAVMYNSSATDGFGSNTGLGPQAGINRGLVRNKLKLGLSAGFQEVYFDSERLSRCLSGNFSSRFTISGNQSARLDLSVTDRVSLDVRSKGFREIRGSVGYLYSFGIKSKSIKKKRNV